MEKSASPYNFTSIDLSGIDVSSPNDFGGILIQSIEFIFHIHHGYVTVIVESSRTVSVDRTGVVGLAAKIHIAEIGKRIYGVEVFGRSLKDHDFGRRSFDLRRRIGGMGTMTVGTFGGVSGHTVAFDSGDPAVIAGNDVVADFSTGTIVLTDVRGAAVTEYGSLTGAISGFEGGNIRILIFDSVFADSGEQAPEVGIVCGHTGQAFDVKRPGLGVFVADIVADSESELLHVVDTG